MRPTLALATLLTLALSCGCRARPQSQGAGARPLPTFTKDVAPILFEHCVPCHRPGQPVPFTLMRYTDARQRADKIAKATGTRKMPPWLPDPVEPVFLGERRLRDDQIETIRRWAATGAMEGNRLDLPRLPKLPDGWQLGQPDLVITMPRAYLLDPGEHDVFRNVVLQPLSLPANRFVRAVEFRTNGAPIHHAIIRVDRTPASRQRDGEDGKPGYEGMMPDVQNPGGYFIGWAPGRGPIVAPEGMPWRLNRGSDLVVELHLLPGKTAVPVQPTVGLFFADRPPVHEPVMLVMGSKMIEIPAGAADYAIADTYSETDNSGIPTKIVTPTKLAASRPADAM